MVFIHSRRGEKAFTQVNVRKWPVEFVNAVRYNTAMLSPALPSVKREAFFKELMRGHYDIMKLLSDYTRPTLKARVKSALRNVPGFLYLVRIFRSIRQL